MLKNIIKYGLLLCLIVGISIGSALIVYDLKNKEDETENLLIKAVIINADKVLDEKNGFQFQFQQCFLKTKEVNDKNYCNFDIYLEILNNSTETNYLYAQKFSFVIFDDTSRVGAVDGDVYIDKEPEVLKHFEVNEKAITQVFALDYENTLQDLQYKVIQMSYDGCEIARFILY